MILRMDSTTLHVGYQPSVTKPASSEKHEPPLQEIPKKGPVSNNSQASFGVNNQRVRRFNFSLTLQIDCSLA